jgi:pyridoxine 4-dehydrogenase
VWRGGPDSARREDTSWYAAVGDDALRAGCERDLRVLGLDSIPVVHLRWLGDDAAGGVNVAAAGLRLTDEDIALLD